MTATLGTNLGAALTWDGGDRERAAIYGLCSIVAAIAGYAAAHIVLHSLRYRALDAPILFAYRDRFVPSPWVARRGELMLVPEGRYGAGLPIAGIDTVEHRADTHGDLLACVTDHGPIELGRFDSKGQARAWQRALERVLAWSRHTAVLLLVVALASAAAACRPRSPITAPPAVEAPAARATTEVTSAPPTPGGALPSPTSVPTSAVPSNEPPPPSARLAMVEDDVPAALAAARARNVPVLVEVWAAWCHTCLSMRAFVLPDPAIAALSERVVFAAVDSENEKNTAFLERYRVGVWPSLFVLEPRDGAVLALWEGSASVEELRAFVLESADARGATRDPALAELRRGVQAQVAGRCTDAVGFYSRSLARGGASWARRGEAVKGLIFCQRRLKQWDACVATGIAEVGSLAGTSAPADVAGTLLDCAGSLKSGPERTRAEELAVARLRALVDAPPRGASSDDRADTLAILAGALRARGAEAEANALLAAQLGLLEAAAAAAPSPEAAATFDYARMNAYLAAGQGDRAVSMLTERKRQMPDSYEPYARLSQVLVALRRYREAETEIEAALARVKGPRRARYLQLQADIKQALGR